MPKKRRSHKRDVPPAVRHRTEQMLAKLKEHYKRGALANRLAQKLDPVPRSFTRDFAEKERIGYTTVMKERLFARRYSQKEFESLCRLRRKPATKGGAKLPFQWGFVPYLLTVPEKKKRTQLQLEAAKQGWTAPELYDEIKKRFPNTRRKAKGSLGGRKWKAGRSLSKALSAISADGTRLQRRCQDVLKTFDEQASPEVKRQLRELSKRLDSAVHQLAQLALRASKNA